jgi:paraquat-inducible protein A
MTHRPTAADAGLSACHTCLKLVNEQEHHCPLCGSTVHHRKPDTLQRTLALLITATLLYIPANMLPIMYTETFGGTSGNTILGGVVLLIKMDSAPIAAVIFFASVMVPSSKLLMMYYLCWSVGRNRLGSERARTVVYRITEFIGKWSMIDVFVVAILVALVHLTGILVIRPGSAAVAFAGVVIITMIAAESFDPRLIWDNLEKEDE